MRSKVPKGIQAIIFDLGDVIVNLDMQRVVDAFSKYTSNDPIKVLDRISDLDAFRLYETGKIDTFEFIEASRVSLELNLTHEQFKSIWNSMLLNIPVQKLELLKRVKDQCHTMVFSNTNAMHEEAFERMIDELHPGHRMSDFVHMAYYSHHVGMRKPDQEVFEFMISEHGLHRQSTLFFDDKKENIEAAKSAQIQGILVSHPDELYQYFDHED
jgi:FMN phosphatase YigB (HAD superfamily)